MMGRGLLMTFFLCLAVSAVWGIQCLDPSGHPVDWYSSYKVPKLQNRPSLFEKGLAHYYLDMKAPTWSLSNRPINESGSAVYNTLTQIYKSQETDITYIMYNDEFPGRPGSSSRGHTKGVVFFDGKSGFWLIHSVPGFPPYKKDGFHFPTSGARNAQIFLCISLPYKALGQVGTQLLYNQPRVYDHQIPKSVDKQFPVLMDVINKKEPPSSHNVIGLQSLGVQAFTSFAKAVSYGKDLYGDLVAPTLKTSLYVQTWRYNGGKLPNVCNGPYKIFNVETIGLPNNVSFKTTKDHSKWATAYKKNSSPSNSGYWTCVGDINRTASQFKRGGGTVCIDNKAVWMAFEEAVDTFERCPSSSLSFSPWLRNSSPSNSGYWTCVGDINRTASQFKRGGGTVCIDNKAVWMAFEEAVDTFERCPSSSLSFSPWLRV